MVYARFCPLVARQIRNRMNPLNVAFVLFHRYMQWHYLKRAVPHFGWFPDLRFASVETNLRGGGSRCRGPLANQRKLTISNDILLID